MLHVTRKSASLSVVRCARKSIWMKVAAIAPRFQYDCDPINFCLKATFSKPIVLKTVGRFFLSARAIVVPTYLSGMYKFVKQDAGVVWVLPVPRLD